MRNSKTYYTVKIYWITPESTEMKSKLISIYPLDFFSALELCKSYIPIDEEILNAPHQSKIINWNDYVESLYKEI